MAVINVRGYKIKVQAKAGTQRKFVERQMAQRTNKQLAEMESEYFPDRAIVRRALEKVYAAEDQLRFLMLDLLERAEEEADKDPDFIPDYVNEDGEGMLYPEHVDAELDGLIHQLFEIGLELRGRLDEDV